MQAGPLSLTLDEIIAQLQLFKTHQMNDAMSLHYFDTLIEMIKLIDPKLSAPEQNLEVIAMIRGMQMSAISVSARVAGEPLFHGSNHYNTFIFSNLILRDVFGIEMSYPSWESDLFEEMGNFCNKCHKDFKVARDSLMLLRKFSENIVSEYNHFRNKPANHHVFLLQHRKHLAVLEHRLNDILSDPNSTLTKKLENAIAEFEAIHATEKSKTQFKHFCFESKLKFQKYRHHFAWKEAGRKLSKFRT